MSAPRRSHRRSGGDYLPFGVKVGPALALFWGVGFATLGWLVFKIAERM
jgi:hypothetical protein